MRISEEKRRFLLVIANSNSKSNSNSNSNSNSVVKEITWVSNYRCPISKSSNRTHVIGHLRNRAPIT